jgi:parallel beta-helix repeat protein
MRRSTLLLLFSGLIVGLLLPAVASGRTFTVHQGQSIQRAVSRAHSGDRIFILPGVYHERGTRCPTEPSQQCAVVVRKDDISLIGRAKKNRPVVIEKARDQYQGVAVARTGDANCLANPSQRIDGSLITNINVNGFGHDGVFLFCVDNWRVTNVSTEDNEEYGIFPSHVGAGRVDNSFASGSNDTGLYIGQSHDVEIDHNLATGNVSGIEIENSTAVTAHDNESTGNTGGILSFTLPGLDVKSNHDNDVGNNNVHDNNKPNTCVDPSDSVCAVPRGTGILLDAADTNTVHDNTVTGNNSFGIAVANLCTGNPSACNPPPSDIDIFPDGNHIVSNVATGNGTNPDPNVPSIFATDLAWDFTGTGNCWSGNTNGTQFPPTLPTCP